MGAYHYESNEAAKEAKREPLFNDILPLYLERLDAQVKKNNGYFVGGHLTWADLLFVSLLDYIDFMAKFVVVDKYQNLKALKNKVLALPKIKAWIEKRPKTDC